MNLDKAEANALISGYIDGELNEADKKKVETLLQTSKEMKELFHLEKNLKDFIKQKIKADTAPFELRSRIKRQIGRLKGRPGFFEIINELLAYHPVASAASFAVILILILMPNFGRFTAGDNVEFKHLRGEIVCLDCDVFSKHVDVAEHSNLLHQPGIKCDNGSIWSLVQTGGEQSVDMRFLRKKIELTGVAFNSLKYIKVEDYHLL